MQPHEVEPRVPADQRREFGAAVGADPAVAAQPHAFVVREISDRVGEPRSWNTGARPSGSCWSTPRCHSLRSVYINFRARRGVSLEVCSKNVGHSDIRTTRQHYEVVQRDIRANANTATAKELDRLLAQAAERPAPRLVA